MAGELNERQRRFADLVLAGRPASRAYREAGYKASTNQAAEANASQLMKTRKVAAYLRERRAEAIERTTVSVAASLDALRQIGDDKGQPGQVRVQAHKAILEAIKDGLAPVPFVLQEAEPLTPVRVAALAGSILRAAVEGRASVKQAEDMLSVIFGTVQALLASEATRPLDDETQAENRPEPHLPHVSWFKPHRPAC